MTASPLAGLLWMVGNNGARHRAGPESSGLTFVVSYSGAASAQHPVPRPAPVSPGNACFSFEEPGPCHFHCRLGLWAALHSERSEAAPWACRALHLGPRGEGGCRLSGSQYPEARGGVPGSTGAAPAGPSPPGRWASVWGQWPPRGRIPSAGPCSAVFSPGRPAGSGTCGPRWRCPRSSGRG